MSAEQGLCNFIDFDFFIALQRIAARTIVQLYVTTSTSFTTTTT